MKTQVGSLNSDNKAITNKIFQRAMITMIIAELSGSLSAVSDGILVGQFYGQTQLASFGVASPYFSIANVIIGILMTGCVAMCTRSIGLGNKKDTTSIFSLTVFLGTAFSVLYGLVGVVFSHPIASLLGAKASAAMLHANTADYLRGVFIGAPAFIMFLVLIPLLQLDGETRLPRIASIAGLASNVLFDLVAIFIIKNGMFGIGLSSALSHYVDLIIVGSHFLKKNSLFKFSFNKIDFRRTRILVKAGIARAFSMLSRGILPMLMNALVLKIAYDAGVAAMSAQNTTTFTVQAFGGGIGAAMIIVGGMAVGEQDESELKDAFKMGLKDILFGVTTFALLICLLSTFITRLFIPESGIAFDMARVAIMCFAISLPFLAFNTMSASYFQITRRNTASILINISIELVYIAIMAYVFSYFIGIHGVWIAYPCGQALLSLTIIIVALLKRDRKNKDLSSIMLIPKWIGVPKENCCEKSIQTMDEVVDFSKEIYAFCEEHNVDSAKTYRLALCIEEMAGNVVDHGFTKDNKNHHLYVRVVIKEDDIVLRLRDDCKSFDLKQKVANWTFDPQNPEKNIGIHMILKIAKNIEYTNTMGINNLIIKL